MKFSQHKSVWQAVKRLAQINQHCSNSGVLGEHVNPYKYLCHYNDVIMTTIASQITSLTVVYSTVYSDADQRKHQSSASLAFVRGIHRGPVNSPHKWPVTLNMFPFDDVIMNILMSVRKQNQDVFTNNYEYLRNQALKAIYCFHNKVKDIGVIPPISMFYIFDTLVRPILTYGSGVRKD